MTQKEKLRVTSTWPSSEALKVDLNISSLLKKNMISVMSSAQKLTSVTCLAYRTPVLIAMIVMTVL